jgi:hypothetical protein
VVSHWKNASLSFLTARFDPHASSFGWVPEPDVKARGTWGLLRSCIVTTVFWASTSLHLNIPRAKSSTTHRAVTRFIWAIAITAVPELMLSIAVTQYFEARILLRTIDELCERYACRNPAWNMTQAFYYNMGGFLVHSAPGTCHGRSDDMERPKTLKMKHMDALAELGWLHLIDVPAERVKEYSKTNRFGEMVALVQTFWFLIQTFVRFNQHLPTSPLEITTTAYAVCNFISWLLWFQKPLDVGFSTEITDVDYRMLKQLTQRRQRASRPNSMANFTDWKSQLPIVKTKGYRFHDFLATLVIWIASVSLFGGLQLLAWNYAFPTTAETIMWRCSCLVIMVEPPLFFVWITVRRVAPDTVSIDFIGLSLTILYLSARIYNVFEGFFSLRLTPPTLYETIPWANWLPHV